MRRPAPAKKHHHGNLRPALIKAGIALLEEGGIDALSLRKCAARAGVTHAAPAHHFDGLAGLKALVYTVNDLKEARRLVADGAWGLFTDYPDRINRESLGVGR